MKAKTINAAVSAAYQQAHKQARKANPKGFLRSRGRAVYVLTRGGILPAFEGQLQDWTGTQKQLDAIMEYTNLPDVTEVGIEGGIDYSDDLAGFADGYYDPWVGEWSVAVWMATDSRWHQEKRAKELNECCGLSINEAANQARQERLKGIVQRNACTYDQAIAMLEAEQQAQDAVDARIAVERDVVSKLILMAAEAGWVCTHVDNGDGGVKVTTLEQAMDEAFAADDATLAFRKNGHAMHVYVVLGNDGWDAVADYSAPAEDVEGWNTLMAAHEAYCEALPCAQ